MNAFVLGLAFVVTMGVVAGLIVAAVFFAGRIAATNERYRIAEYVRGLSAFQASLRTDDRLFAARVLGVAADAIDSDDMSDAS